MTNLNFNVPLTGIDGKQTKQTLADVLSSYIGGQTKGQTLKLYGWHKSLQVGEELNLDEADVEALKKLISENEDMYVFVKGQLLDVIKEAGAAPVAKKLNGPGPAKKALAQG